MLHRHCIFYRLKVCGNPVLSKSYSHYFSTAFPHFVSLCHSISDFLIVIIVTVICDQRFLMFLLEMFWGHHRLHLYESVNLINKCMCSDCSSNWLFPCLSLSIGLRHSIEIGQLITIQFFLVFM